MAVTTGTRLGSYEVVAQIGAGGMGEVYQAHDTKLGRNVAIKVLPEAFAHDSERLSRFQREAKMLAALNHPNIATIYGLEQSNGTSYLVMELVAGDTLSEPVKPRAALVLSFASVQSPNSGKGFLRRFRYYARKDRHGIVRDRAVNQ
jgi:serine/threonine protein kinase